LLSRLRPKSGEEKSPGVKRDCPFTNSTSVTCVRACLDLSSLH
jgi:hypothetical protein